MFFIVLVLLLFGVIYFKIKGNLVIPYNRPDFIIVADRTTYFTYYYQEENGCVLFDNKKVCGSYTIIKNN